MAISGLIEQTIAQHITQPKVLSYAPTKLDEVQGRFVASNRVYNFVLNKKGVSYSPAGQGDSLLFSALYLRQDAVRKPKVGNDKCNAGKSYQCGKICLGNRRKCHKGVRDVNDARRIASILESTNEQLKNKVGSEVSAKAKARGEALFGARGKRVANKNKSVLPSDLIKSLNGQLGTELNSSDQKLFEKIAKDAISDDRMRKAATANTKDNFSLVLNDYIQDQLIENLDGNEKTVNTFFGNKNLQKAVSNTIIDSVYSLVRANPKSTDKAQYKRLQITDKVTKEFFDGTGEHDRSDFAKAKISQYNDLGDDGLKRLEREIKERPTPDSPRDLEFYMESVPYNRLKDGYSGYIRNNEYAAVSDQIAYVQFMNNMRDKTLKDLPEGREKELVNALNEVKDKYISLLTSTVGSGAYSPFIAGGAKFNKKQADRRSKTADNANKRFVDFTKVGADRIINKATGIDKIREQKEAVKKAGSAKAIAEFEAQAASYLRSTLKKGDEVIGGFGETIKVKRVNQKSITEESGVQYKYEDITPMANGKALEPKEFVRRVREHAKTA